MDELEKILREIAPGDDAGGSWSMFNSSAVVRIELVSAETCASAADAYAAAESIASRLTADEYVLVNAATVAAKVDPMEENGWRASLNICLRRETELNQGFSRLEL